MEASASTMTPSFRATLALGVRESTPADLTIPVVSETVVNKESATVSAAKISAKKAVQMIGMTTRGGISPNLNR